MKALSREEAAERTRASYGLLSPPSDGVDLDILAESLRRAASYLAPSRKAPLIREALRATEGFLAGGDLSNVAMTLLERLIAVGDLIEQTSDGFREIYLGSPARIRLSDETTLLVGVRPFGQPLIVKESRVELTHRGGLRFLPSDALAEGYGLAEWSVESWMAAPTPTTPDALIADYQRRLDSSAQVGDRPGLSILDSSVSTLNYAQRWRAPGREDDGIFIARRDAEYGARTWSMCVFEHGTLARFIDLPVTAGIERGRDEAWRFQAALDAARGNAQYVVVRQSDPKHSIIDFLGPVPSFATRYLETVGESVPHSPGALFSVHVQSTDVDAIQHFLLSTLWMSNTQGSAKS